MTQNPAGVTVTTVPAAAGNAEAHQKTIAALAAGSPPNLVINWHFLLSDFFNQGGTVDVDAALKGNADWKKARPSLYPYLADGFSWQGKLFAIPVYNSLYQMYYQPNLLRRAGLPTPPPRTWNWDQFSDFQKKAATPPDITGYDDEWTYARTGMMALGNGFRPLSQDGTKFVFNSPEVQETVEWELGLVKSGLMRAHDGSANGGWSEKLPQGRVVFQLAIAARVPTYRKDGVDFGTCYYPIGPKSKDKKNYSHGVSYGVAVFQGDPKKVQAALLAGLWTTRPDAGAVYAEVGGVPPSYKHTVEDALFQAQFKKDAESWPFYDILPNYIPMPSFPGFIEARNEVDGQLRAIWSGKTSVRDGLNEATRLGQARLDQARQAK